MELPCVFRRLTIHLSGLTAGLPYCSCHRQAARTAGEAGSAAILGPPYCAPPIPGARPPAGQMPLRVPRESDRTPARALPQLLWFGHRSRTGNQRNELSGDKRQPASRSHSPVPHPKGCDDNQEEHSQCFRSPRRRTSRCSSRLTRTAIRVAGLLEGEKEGEKGKDPVPNRTIDFRSGSVLFFLYPFFFKISYGSVPPLPSSPFAFPIDVTVAWELGSCFQPGDQGKPAPLLLAGDGSHANEWHTRFRSRSTIGRGTVQTVKPRGPVCRGRTLRPRPHHPRCPGKEPPEGRRESEHSGPARAGAGWSTGCNTASPRKRL